MRKNFAHALLLVAALFILCGCRVHDPVTELEVKPVSILLMEIDAYDLVGASVVTLRYASHGYTTARADTPSDTPYLPRIEGGFSLSQSMYRQGTTGGGSEVGAGSISLANTDGALDVLLTGYALTGRPVRIGTVEPGAALSTAVQTFTGTCALPEFEQDRVVIGLRDKTVDFEKEIQTTVYAGDNVPPSGKEGGTDLKGTPKPLAYGVVKNVPAVKVNDSLLIYQVHDGAIQAVDAVYDGGVAFDSLTGGRNFIVNGSFDSGLAGWHVQGVTWDGTNHRATGFGTTSQYIAWKVSLRNGADYRLTMDYVVALASGSADVYAGGFFLSSSSTFTGPADPNILQTLWAYSSVFATVTPPGTTINLTPPLDFTSAVDGEAWLILSPKCTFSAGGTLAVDNVVLDSPFFDVANLAALEAATIAPGAYATCLAEGLIRLGSSPSHDITVDLQGDDTGGTYVESIGGIIERIALTRAGLSAGDLDSAAFTALKADAALSPAGIYIPQGGSIRSVLDRLCGSLAWWTFTPTGKLTVGRLLAPEGLTADGEMDLVTDANNVRLLSSNDPGEGEPIWRVSVNYDHNELVQDSAAVVGAGGWTSSVLNYAITDARRAYVDTEWRTSVAEDASIKTAYRHAKELTVDTCLRDAADADTESARLLALYGVARLRLQATVLKASQQSWQLGDVLEITYDRWGLAAGRNMVVIGREESWSDLGLQVVTYDLWG